MSRHTILYLQIVQMTAILKLYRHRHAHIPTVTMMLRACIGCLIQVVLCVEILDHDRAAYQSKENHAI